jgi:glycosyltransferase involved in cell wall biosynthesis
MALERSAQLEHSLFVSIIIPTYNSAKRLSICLTSIMNQVYPLKEVVVVDNYSEDETRRIAKGFGAKVILYRGNQAAARNVGLAHSRGAYVLFLDSDQQLDASVIMGCVLTCLTCGMEAVKIYEYFIGLTFWGKCSALWKNNMVVAWGCRGGIPRFYCRDVFLQSAAFDESLRFWEDLELYQRIKLQGVGEAWCMGRIIHYELDSLRKVVRKYVSYGRSIAAFKGHAIKAPYVSTIKLTLSTLVHLFKKPGRSVSVLLGCLFLVGVKSLNVAVGFLLSLARSSLQEV